MANDLNACSFIGRLGKDPEIRFTQSGDAIASFSLACGESYKDKHGQKVEKTEWINVTVFGGLAKVVHSYVKKGSRLFIEGKFTTEKYTDKQGVDKYSTKIVLGFGGKLQMLDSKPQGDGGNQQQAQSGYGQQHSTGQNPQAGQGYSTAQQQQQSPPSADGSPDFSDDIPF